MKKVVIVLLLISAAVLLFFAENIKGYYRFKHFCDTEGGLTVYENVERGVGWTADRKGIAASIANNENVAFVRFPDKKNQDQYFDLKYVEGRRDLRSSAQAMDADFTKVVKYKLDIQTIRVPGELRLVKQFDEVWDVSRNKLLAKYNSFTFAKYDRRKTFLAAPSNVRCHRYNMEEFNKIFK